MTAATHTVTPKKKKSIWTPAQIILVAIIFLAVLTCVLPFLNVIAISLSSKSAILRGDVSFWPVEFETQAYEILFADKSMINCLFYTVKLTVIYTAIAMVMTILMAYPLTKKRLRGRQFFSFLRLRRAWKLWKTVLVWVTTSWVGCTCRLLLQLNTWQT